ncbi:MAG: nitronate monooxygenase [Streptosporangiaceae bacterium]
MALHTAFTDSFALQHPIALAPMGGVSGGALAAAVSNGGGLGIVGAGREDPDWLDRELEVVVRTTSRPWGVGFQSWATDAVTVERALARHPRAVMLSFGDPGPLIPPVRAAGAALILR